MATDEQLDALEAEHVARCPKAALYSQHAGWRPGPPQRLGFEYLEAVEQGKHEVECLTRLKRFRANR